MRRMSYSDAILEMVRQKAFIEYKRAPTICQELRKELGEKRCPSLRQIQRWIQQARQQDDVEESYRPIGLADTDGLDAEEITYLFDVCRSGQQQAPLLKDDGKLDIVTLPRPVLKRELEWVLKVHAAAPDLPPYLVLGIADLYAQEHAAAKEQGRTPQTRHLDFGLVYRPWRSEEGLRAYVQLVDRGVIPEAYRYFWGGSPGPDKPLSFDAVRGRMLIWWDRLLNQVGGMMQQREAAPDNPAASTEEEDSNGKAQTER